MNWEEVGADMIKEAKASASSDWPTLRDYAVHEFENLARVAAQIEKRKNDPVNPISELDAKFRMDQYYYTSQSVLYAIEGLKNIVIQDAWNAAMRVLATAINTAIKWPLL
jgi:hypothetical protein